MFKRPEEIIVLVLALLWVALSYYFAAILISDAYTILLITVLTFVWAAICFLLWQRNLSRHIWPLFLGSLVACWWPYFTWLASRRSRRYMVFRLDIQIDYRPDSRYCRLCLQVEAKPEKQNFQHPCLIPYAVFSDAFSISDMALRLSTIPIKCYTLHTI